MKKLMLMLMAFLTLATQVMAATATDFATALPTSLVPTGFWGLVMLLFAIVVSIGGITLVIKLIRRAM